MRLLILMFMLVTTVAHSTDVVVRNRTEKNTFAAYNNDVLKLALDKTEPEYGNYVLKYSDQIILQKRGLALLESGSSLVDVVWGLSTAEREKQVDPIRIPIQKGLLGYRILLVQKGDVDRFRNIRTLDELKALMAGQGHDWPDTEILRAGGLPVHGSPTYNGLLQMLESGRIDYFPRGVGEAYIELAEKTELNLMVEPNLMIYYPAPDYFFVNKSRPELKRRIEEGLNKALKDGSFDQLFFNHPANKQLFENARMNERRLFKMDNPLLSEESRKIMRNKTLIYEPM